MIETRKIVPCLLIVSLIFFGGLGCDQQNQQGVESTGPPVVFCANAPLAYWVGELLTDVDVQVFQPETEFPRTWNPSDEQVALLQRSKLLVTVGADYESWLAYVSIPDDRILEVSRPLYEHYITIESPAHRHGPDGPEHSHTGDANYFWLDPQLGMEMVSVLADGLRKQFPDAEEQISVSEQKLIGELEQIDRQLEQLKAELSRRLVLASDARFAYLLRRLQWLPTWLHWTDHDIEELPADAWQKFDTAADRYRNMTVSGTIEAWFPFEPSESTRLALEERNIPYRVLPSLESELKTAGWPDAFSDLIQKLKAAPEPSE